MQIIDLKSFIEKKLNQFEDMIAYKNIIIEKKFNASPEISMNSHLADILFSNIIGNAIKHNIINGKIIFELNGNLFIISNSGKPLEIPTEKLFQRFQKANISSDSAGLGLSIVKQICTIYDFGLNYTYSYGIHTIYIYF